MSKTANKKIIGIDFGAKKLGIAISDKYNNFALPRLILQNDKNLIKNLEKVIQEEDIGEIIIGESTDYKGDENPIMKDIKNFADVLRDKFNLQIYFEPEFLTSAQVRSTQGDSRMLDASAAALILQSFLDKRNS